MKGRRMIVFSDIDGTLLEHGTVDYRNALPGLELLRHLAVPLVLVSSKTFGEMEAFCRELGLDGPFAFENGAGIALPIDCGGYRTEIAGRGVEDLRSFIPAIEAAAGTRVVTLPDMPLDELIEYTGLSRDGSLLAKDRRASLPFVAGKERRLSREAVAAMETMLAEKGLTAPWGGKFHQLRYARATKEGAVQWITKFFADGSGTIPLTVGIGDSENDFGMLDAVDRAYLVRSGISGIDYSKVPYRVTDGSGPAGFTEAVRLACGSDPR